MSEVLQLAPDVVIMKKSGALIQWTRDVSYGGNSVASQTRNVKGIEIYQWGADNLHPQNLLKKIRLNHQKGQLLEKERNFLVGRGIWPFEMSVVNGRFSVVPVEDVEMWRWSESINAFDLVIEAAEQYVFSNNIFIHFKFNLFGEFVGFEVLDSCKCRLEKASLATHRVEWVHITDWANSGKIGTDENPLLTLPLYRPAMEDLELKKDFVMHIKNPKVGQDNYSIAPWWGTMNWTEVANLIPEFHKNGLMNGYNIKYHVELPLYLLEKHPVENREAVKMQYQNDMDKMLAGTENGSKTVLSWYELDMMNKPLPGVKITPINSNDPSTQYIELDKQANINQASGHGINPTLAGIDTGGKLGGSGSEMRIAYQLHIALNTPIPRRLLLKPFTIIHKLMGWDKTKPNRYFDFLEIDVTTIAQNPTGSQSINIGANAT
jgi:hypothetical protein